MQKLGLDRVINLIVESPEAIAAHSGIRGDEHDVGHFVNVYRTLEIVKA